MKKLGLLALLVTLSSLAQAHYDGNELRGYLKAGKVAGKTYDGEACSVTTSYLDQPYVTMVRVEAGTKSVLFNKLTSSNEIYRDEMPMYFEVVTEFQAREGNPNPTTRQGILISDRGTKPGRYVQVFENENDIYNSANNRVVHCIIPWN